MAMFRRFFNVVVKSTGNYFNYSLTKNSILICQPCATLKNRTIEKKLGIPPRPKRPLSPFIKFSMSERPKILQETPDILSKDILKKVGEKWKNLSIEHKEKMRKEYLKDLEEYTKEVMMYEKNLTPEQKSNIKNEKFKVHEASERSKMRSKLKELGKPKKPPTTFILYMLSKVHTKSPDVKFSDWVSIVAKEWNEATAEVREKYEGENKKHMEQYKKEMIDWEQKMIKLGHIDVVRKQVLMDLKGKNMPENK